MSEIENIASKHLGRSADGTVNAAYVTPDSIDKSLLVAVPRSLNRNNHDIDESIFTGWDVWHCYEFSTLTNNGLPVAGLLKISYPSNSCSIVESKSLKLYLNSFNMVKSGIHTEDVIQNIIDQVRLDLADALKCEVGVGFIDERNDATWPSDFFNYNSFRLLENESLFPEIRNVIFDDYNESANLLETCMNGDNGIYRPVKWRSSVLRSNCRITNQPDWGDVFIEIDGPKVVTPASMLRYIVSMRRENHFHEEVCELIYKRLYDLLQPNKLMVSCLYTRRGGIDINPLRASDQTMICTNFRNTLKLTQRTTRQ